jgi:acetate kinase
MKIVLLNAGSTSLKCTVAESTDGTIVGSAQADWTGTASHYSFSGTDGEKHSENVSWKGHREAVPRMLKDLTSRHAGIAAVGHRVVHGGPFTSSVRITPETRSQIAALVDLAPLHNPPSLETLAAAEAELPNVPHVAVFDTAFHATLPPEAWTYPVPLTWTRDWGIRRYGFHGLSHAYCSQRAAEMLKQPVEKLRLVICHLGGGCSAAAVRGGRCIDTTMGFTPLEGLMMATRSGSVDPSIVLCVLQHHGLTARQVEAALNHESGLLGVSGVSGDMRQVLDAGRAGNQQAELALAIYTHRVRQAIGALTVTLGGIDALVFTAGVGEHGAEIRKRTCEGLACLGLELDTEANAACRPDADVSRAGSRGRILVIGTREDVTMLREVLKVLGKVS